MPRYTVRRARPASLRHTRNDDFDEYFGEDYDDDKPVITSIEVDPSEPRPTGILDQYGDMFMIGPDPIGFKFSEND